MANFLTKGASDEVRAKFLKRHYGRLTSETNTRASDPRGTSASGITPTAKFDRTVSSGSFMQRQQQALDRLGSLDKAKGVTFQNKRQIGSPNVKGKGAFGYQVSDPSEYPDPTAKGFPDNLPGRDKAKKFKNSHEQWSDIM